MESTGFQLGEVFGDGLFPDLSRGFIEDFSNVFLVNLPGFLGAAQQEKSVRAVLVRLQ